LFSDAFSQRRPHPKPSIFRRKSITTLLLQTATLYNLATHVNMSSKMSSPFQQQAQQQQQHSEAVPINGHGGAHQPPPQDQKDRNGSGSYDLYRTFSPSDVGLWSALHSKGDPAGSTPGGFWSKFWGK
jgi:hypothetical protein